LGNIGLSFSFEVRKRFFIGRDWRGRVFRGDEGRWRRIEVRSR
jgi:hypothetical protein